MIPIPSRKKKETLKKKPAKKVEKTRLWGDDATSSSRYCPKGGWGSNAKGGGK